MWGPWPGRSFMAAAMPFECKEGGGPAPCREVNRKKGRGRCLGCRSVAGLAIQTSQERRAPVVDFQGHRPSDLHSH